jgi:nitrate/nitrite transporter NarK
MKQGWAARAAGAAAGLANGCFGGGGGMVFLPILSRWGNLTQRKLYATCVAVIFPVCLISAAIYLLRGEVDASALRLQPSEVAQAKWADREEVFAMMADGRFVPYHESLVELLFAMRKRTDGLREE